MEEEVKVLIKEANAEDEFMLPLGNRRLFSVTKVSEACLHFDFLPNKHEAQNWDMPSEDKRMPVVYASANKPLNKNPSFCVFKQRFGPFFTICFMPKMATLPVPFWKVICMQDPNSPHDFYACYTTCMEHHNSFRWKLRAFCRAWLQRHHTVPLFQLSPSIITTPIRLPLSDLSTIRQPITPPWPPLSNQPFDLENLSKARSMSSSMYNFQLF